MSEAVFAQKRPSDENADQKLPFGSATRKRLQFSPKNLNAYIRKRQPPWPPVGEG
jgi:hypothetical protein